MNYEAMQIEITEESAPYWAGLKKHELLIQQCANCGKCRHYPRPICDACYSFDYNWQKSTGNGKVQSWTVVHHPFNPVFKDFTPYLGITVDLEENVRLLAPVFTEIESVLPLKVGTVLTIDYLEISNSLTLPTLKPILKL